MQTKHGFVRPSTLPDKDKSDLGVVCAPVLNRRKGKPCCTGSVHSNSNIALRFAIYMLDLTIFLESN